MKKLILGFALIAGAAFNGYSSGTANTAAAARAERLSHKMAKDLQLNNFQQRKIKSINEALVQELVTIEKQHQNNPSEMDKASRAVYSKRDQQMENILSTDQYTYYFRSREKLNKFDRSLATELTQN